MMRISGATGALASLALRDGIFYLLPGRKIPTSHEPLRLPISAGGGQFVKIFRTIRIARNARQLEYDTGEASCLCGGEMRQKTVIAKAERKQIGWRAEGGIRAASGCIWHQKGATLRRGIDDLLHLGAID
jgi:hypothetical protein